MLKDAVPVRLPVQGSRTENAGRMRIETIDQVRSGQVTSGLLCAAWYLASPGNVYSGVSEEVLVMRLQSVEVIVVLPLSRHPEKSDILHLGWNDRKVGLHISVQEVGHHYPISHHVNHEVADPGEIFDLQSDGKYLLVISPSPPACCIPRPHQAISRDLYWV